MNFSNYITGRHTLLQNNSILTTTFDNDQRIQDASGADFRRGVNNVHGTQTERTSREHAGVQALSE